MRARASWRLAAALAATLTFASAAPAKPSSEGFAKFIAGLWPLAAEQGVSRATFEAAFHGVTFDASVVARTRPSRVAPGIR